MSKKTIKEMIKEAGITQRELAQKLGIKQSAVSYLLSSKADPKLSSLARISVATGIGISDLVENYEVWRLHLASLELDKDPWE